jgi:hypothetical protein
MMNLQRVYAFSVAPSRLRDAPQVAGGKTATSGELQAALAQAANPLDDDGSAIAFDTDTQTRTNEVRDLCLEVAFEPRAAPGAATRLATRLATAMDERSDPCLFVLAVYAESDRRRLHMWTFPKEEAFKLKTGARPTIELLTDVFSRRSRLRKGARFEGRNDRVSFMEGVAFDYQATFALKPIADLWIVRFLQARLAITSLLGTRSLAECLKYSFATAETQAEREELYKAAIALQADQQKRWSLQQVASRYLSPPYRDRFLEGAKNVESTKVIFDLDKAQLEALVGTRVFSLERGVIVSAPFEAMDKNVHLEGPDKDRLKVEGRVLAEKIQKSRRRREGEG